MSHRTRQRGITLIEIILWSAIVAAAAVALFLFAGRARVAAAVETEQRQVEQLVRTVDGLFQLQPNFAALGTNGAAYLDLRGAERSGLKFTRTDHGVLTLATGVGNGELNLAVWDVEQPSGPAIRSGGYRLAYQGLSAAECVGLASALGKSAHQVRVGVSGLDDVAAGLVAHRYDRGSGPDQLAELCARDGRGVRVLRPGPGDHGFRAGCGCSGATLQAAAGDHVRGLSTRPGGRDHAGSRRHLYGRGQRGGVDGLVDDRKHLPA